MSRLHPKMLVLGGAETRAFTKQPVSVWAWTQGMSWLVTKTFGDMEDEGAV